MNLRKGEAASERLAAGQSAACEVEEATSVYHENAPTVKAQISPGRAWVLLKSQSRLKPYHIEKLSRYRSKPPHPQWTLVGIFDTWRLAYGRLLADLGVDRQGGGHGR